MLRTDPPTLDALLQAHAGVLGRDFTAYRNHAYRVANLCLARPSSDPDAVARTGDDVGETGLAPPSKV